MVSTIYTSLKPMLHYRLNEKQTKMYWYHCNDTVNFLNAAIIPMFHLAYSFKKCTTIPYVNDDCDISI